VLNRDAAAIHIHVRDFIRFILCLLSEDGEVGGVDSTAKEASADSGMAMPRMASVFTSDRIVEFYA
jgi:hypothetical protein